jgi:hypothetical protein
MYVYVYICIYIYIYIYIWFCVYVCVRDHIMCCACACVYVCTYSWGHEQARCMHTFKVICTNTRTDLNTYTQAHPTDCYNRLWHGTHQKLVYIPIYMHMNILNRSLGLPENMSKVVACTLAKYLQTQTHQTGCWDCLRTWARSLHAHLQAIYKHKHTKQVVGTAWGHEQARWWFQQVHARWFQPR